MTYNDFKKIAYKYKYETALETDSARVSYGELLESVSALYNSFCQMGLVSKTVAVMTGNCKETVISVLTCLRAGCRCVLLRASGPKMHIKERLSAYRPSAAILCGRDLAHLSHTLESVGCSCAITVEKAPDSALLPSVYTFSELLQLNDYTVYNAPVSEGSVVTAYDATHADIAQKIADTPLRKGIYIGLPLYSGIGFDALCATLLCGRKCVFAATPSKQLFKKKSVAFALLYNGAGNFGVDAEYYEPPNTFCINNELLYPEEFEKAIFDAIGYNCRCDYDGERIKVTVMLGADADLQAVASSPLSRATADACADAFYGISCRKTVIFKKLV